MNLVNKAWILALLGIAAAAAQPYGRPPALRDVGIEQKLNAQIPLDLTFVDESGRPVRLGDLFGRKPVVLSFVYYECPMLCNLVLSGEMRGFRQLALDIGRDFDVVTLSFDPKETAAMAAAKKVNYIEKYNREGAGEGWHFLTGGEESIRALADAVGFHYSWDDSTNQWAHASGIVILTPDGRVSRYLNGIEYPAKNLRLALVEASDRKIGSIQDAILLFCYHYDPSTGRYTFGVMNALRVTGSATLLGLCTFVFINLRRNRNQEPSGR